MKVIGIIGAMNEEVLPFLRVFPSTKVELGGNIFYEALHEDKKLIFAYSKIGKVHAALTASTMILHFKVEAIIFSGVAGALKNDLRIGDMLLATSLCQHDVDITAFGHPLGFIPESSVFIATSEYLNAIATDAAHSLNIPLISGVVASGDTFIQNRDRKLEIAREFNAIAVEMEGASIAVVASLFNIPFCVLRAISDNADEKADINFDEFLEQSAGRSAKLVIAMIEMIE